MLLLKNKNISQESLRATHATIVIPAGQEGSQCSIDINGVARVVDFAQHGQDCV